VTPVDWGAVTAIGTVLGGLALPIAFIQIGTQRVDRLRAQVSQIGIWADEPEPAEEGAYTWAIPVFIRNSTELPVVVNAADLSVQPWGYDDIPADDLGRNVYASKKSGTSQPVYIAPGTIRPLSVWTGRPTYRTDDAFDQPQPPRVTVSRVIVTDAAGRQWEVRPDRAGHPRLIRRWRRWWWKCKGDL
jgi:hypothetical protein